jgi:hypothetical protein
MMTKLEHFQVFENLLKNIKKNLNHLKQVSGETKDLTDLTEFLNTSLDKTTYPELVKLDGHLESQIEHEMAKWMDSEIKKYNEGLLNPWQMKALESIPCIQDDLEKV